MLTPPDTGGGRLEVGVAADGPYAFAAIHDDDGCHSGVTLSGAALAEIVRVLDGQDPPALPGNVMATVPGASGGAIVLRRGGRGDVSASVVVPGGATRSATYLRRGVADAVRAVADELRATP